MIAISILLIALIGICLALSANQTPDPLPTPETSTDFWCDDLDFDWPER